ncbi:MAG: hypothetical protein FWC01_07270 [Treponema sp.]|nr:hypothetical protein [Treponema sp.]MCL2238015.1 hypothetical protein [Treponema sp.]
MPWRLILFILIFGIFLAFVTFNLENKCDISFGSEKLTLKEVPIFLTVFISFLMGLVCAFPLVLFIKKNRKDKLIKGLQSKSDTSFVDPPLPDENIKKDAEAAKKRFFSKRNGGK